MICQVNSCGPEETCVSNGVEVACLCAGFTEDGAVCMRPGK